ncbi:MAG: guanylate kinase [Planctomycetota bacterium]|jgi:guanylate kinase
MSMSREPGRQRGLLLVVSGPSGSGKTTISRAVERRLEGTFSVSATTRPQSKIETRGHDYDFLSQEEFLQKIEAGAFLEYAQLFGEHWYGTPRRPVEQQLAEGRLVILDIDVQGALQVRESMPEALLIFLVPPSDEELLRRLRGRGREGEDSIQRRFAEAQKEIEIARTSGAYDATVVNDVLEQAVDETCRLVEQRRAGERA